MARWGRVAQTQWEGQPRRGSFPDGSSQAILESFCSDMQAAWVVLRGTPGGAAGVFEEALRRTRSLLPSGIPLHPLNDRSLVTELRQALQDRHPEEIRVMRFALTLNLVEVTGETRGRRSRERVAARCHAEP